MEISQTKKYFRKAYQKKTKSKINKQLGGGNARANAPKKESSVHKYYIVRCLNDLDNTILSSHLDSLGLEPDSHAMKCIENLYLEKIKNLGISEEKFCESYNKKTMVTIPDGLVKADVFFYHINSTLLDKPFYNYPKFLCNVVNIHYSLLDKGDIYTNICKYNSKNKNKLILKYFIETFTLLLEDKKKFIFPDYYILRPISGFGGSEIIYVNNEKNLMQVIQKYKDHNNPRGNPKYKLTDIIASKIITDLLLFKGRKFHLRMYYIVAVLEGEISCFLLDTGIIYTAKNPYNLDVPFREEVHDTHLKSTDADYFFPKDLTLENISSLSKDKYSKDEFDTNTILEGIMQIAKGISNIVKGNYGDNPKSLLYEHQSNGYHVYGLDILVRDNLEPVLVECNYKPGFSLKNLEYKKELSEHIYGWINETILEPLFNYPGKATSNARKHRTYIPFIAS